jgi:hypothetical protein
MIKIKYLTFPYRKVFKNNDLISTENRRKKSNVETSPRIAEEELLPTALVGVDGISE